MYCLPPASTLLTLFVEFVDSASDMSLQARLQPTYTRVFKSCVLARRAQVSDSFPFEWIKKKWREGFFVTSMATANTQWAVVMSRTTGISHQVRMGMGCA